MPEPIRNFSPPPRDPGPLPRHPTGASEVPIHKLDRRASQVIAVMAGPLRPLSDRFVERSRWRANSDAMHGRWYQPELELPAFD